MSDGVHKATASWLLAATVFGGVLAVQLWLVAAAGTDVPFYDQWQIEGGWLYPRWTEGSLHAADLLQPFNEHRIVWSHLLNLGLFWANGQWDPLLQLMVVAGVRAGTAAMLATLAGRGLPARDRWFVAGAVLAAFLPHLAWHNVLWGIESFVLILSLLTLWLLGMGPASRARTTAGLVVGLAALVAMGPGIIGPLALLGWAAFRTVEARRVDLTTWRLAWPALLLLAIGLALRAGVPGHGPLEAASGAQFMAAFFRLLGWPHGQPLAAALMNLPLLLVVAGRLLHRRRPAPGEDFVLLVAGWSVTVALATAWARGGGDELVVGVPSRYVDFLVLLPLANVWCVAALMREAAPRWRNSVRLTAGAWAVFLFAGWLALSAQVMRGIILPRARDREAPVRLLREFQLTGNPAVYAGQSRLLRPHPDLPVVQAVLQDPRLEGRLPPSLQPDRPMGPLSHAARALLGR